MDALHYSAARKYMAATMDRVCDDHEPVIITRQGARSVVLMSLEDFNAMEETAYLLRSSENARRLRGSISQSEKGELIQRGLMEE